MSSGFALEWLFQRAANKNVLLNVFPERSLKAHEQYPQKYFSKRSLKAHEQYWLKAHGALPVSAFARSVKPSANKACCEKGLVVSGANIKPRFLDLKPFSGMKAPGQ